MLNENSSFESRLGGKNFFLKKDFLPAYENGFLANQNICSCPLQSWIFLLSSPDLGKFMAFCLTSSGCPCMSVLLFSLMLKAFSVWRML